MSIVISITANHNRTPLLHTARIDTVSYCINDHCRLLNWLLFTGISWCLYNMAAHPEYQDLCRQEINKVLGERDMFSW